MSAPARRMEPACGSNCPVSWLISVVLPAPFGPMIACNSPFATSSETLSVAVMPPNRRTSFSTRNKGSAMAQPPDKPDNAATPEQPDHRIDDAPDQIDAAEQAEQAEIIELHPVRQVDQAAEIAALVDGQAVVAAIA